MSGLGAAQRRGPGLFRDISPGHAAMLLRPLYPNMTELEAAAYAVGVAGRPVAEVKYPEDADLWRDAGIEVAYILGRDGDGS